MLFRQLLRAQGGEDADETGTPADEAEERAPWTLSHSAEHALEREIELARLECENQELRRMLGLIPSQPRPDSAAEIHAAFDARRTEAMHQRVGGLMQSDFASYRTGSPS